MSHRFFSTRPASICLSAITVMVVLGSRTDGAAVSGAAAAAAYSDPATLTSMLTMTRSGLSGFSVEYGRTVYEGIGVAQDAWIVRWDESSFVIEAKRAGVSSPHADGSRRVWDAADKSGKAIWFDPSDGIGECEVTSDPLKVQLGDILPDYCFLLGFFPTRTLATGQPLTNDVVVFLHEPGGSIRPDQVECEGYSCVMVEQRRADGTMRLSVAIAPSLGGAVVRSETYAQSGSLASRSTTTAFWQPDPEMIALPLSGVYQSFAADGSVLSERHVQVAVTAEGSPCAYPGVGPSEADFVVPEGFSVVNLDTGERSIASNDRHSTRRAWPIAAMVSVSVTAIAGFVAIRRRRVTMDR